MKAVVPVLQDCSEYLILGVKGEKTRHICNRFVVSVAPLQNSYVETLTPGPQSVNLCGNRIFIEVINSM